MATTAKHYLSTVLRWAWQDLQPFEGRFEMAWRVAALCSLATLVFMTYGIPMAAIGCYLILYLMKPDGAESAIMAGALAVLIGLAILSLIYLAEWTVDAPWLRLVVILSGSFLFVYLGAASQVGPEGNVLALVIGFAMTLIGDVPNGEIATRAILYAGLMAVTPMALIIGFSLFLGRSPLRLLRQTLARRLQAAAAALDSPDALPQVHHLLAEGNETLDKWAQFVSLLHLCPKHEARYLRDAIDESYTVMLAATVLSAAPIPSALRHELSARCRQAVQQFPPTAARNSISHEAIAPTIVADTAPNKSLPSTPSASLDGQITDNATHNAVTLASAALHRLHTREPGPTREKYKQPFFHADALSNPTYQHFAIKTTAAATISYLAYTAIDWQGIHTAMITCYVAALGSTAETLHKLTLRIIGCLIGAAMGVGSILFLFPYMTSIGSLMLLVFIAILIAGWVSSGNERIAYAGIQIGLAFLLTVLQGFGPDLHLSAASDRIMGILLGNLVTYLVFTRIWPLSIVSLARANLASLLDQLRDLSLKFQEGRQDIAGIARCTKGLSDIHEQLSLSLFEPQRLRPDDVRINALQQLTASADSLCRRVVFENTTNQSAQLTNDIIQLQETLATEPIA